MEYEMDRRTFLKLLSCAGGVAAGHTIGLTGCSQGPQSKQRNPRLVLLYATCSVNKDYLSPYNPNIKFTPALHQFAAQSKVFADHQTESGQSGIAFASLFSGNQADKHGIFDHPRMLDQSVLLISEVFAHNGYDTYYYSTHPMANYELGYGQGIKPENAIARNLSDTDATLNEIVTRLKKDPKYRAFIFTSFTVTHGPYTSYCREYGGPEILPEEFEKVGVSVDEFNRLKGLYLDLEREGFAFCFDFPNTVARLDLSQEDFPKFIRVIEYLYKCSVFYLDTIFGKVMDKLRRNALLDESLVVFTADHGETLYRDNTFFKFCHGFQLAPEVLSVPFIMRAPSLGIGPGIYSTVTRSIDVFPTMAELCNVHMPQASKPDGVDLSPAIIGRNPPLSLPAYSHTVLVADDVANWPEYKGTLYFRLYPRKDPELMWVRVKKGDVVYKYAKFDPDREDFAPSAFDHAKDPAERTDLFDQKNDEHLAILADLKKYKQNLVETCRLKYSNLDSGIPEEERLRRLKSLGYI